METGSLEKYMFKKKAVLKENDIGEKVSEIGSGIKYLHKNNIIHGGLKPSSILLCHVMNVFNIGYMQTSEFGVLGWRNIKFDDIMQRYKLCTSRGFIFERNQSCLWFMVLRLNILWILNAKTLVFGCNSENYNAQDC